MTTSDQKLTSKINPYKMIYPILIGLAVVAYMFYREFEPGSFQLIHFTWLSVLWLLVAILCMVIRDLGYIIRIRILSDNKLSWYQSLRIIMLWEFTSAVTPSAVGGTSLAILFVHKENISVGRSSAIVMATSFLDELYFILMFPIILLSVNETALWDMPNVVSGVSRSLISIALIGYFLKLGYLVVLCYGLFYNPRGLKFFLLRIFKLRFLKRWRQQANTAGTDIVRNSYELRKKSLVFWLKTFGSTFISWTARYWVVNAILMAFWAGNYDWAKQFLIFARQLIMWIMMLVSPTPGGSGFAEFVFKEYLGEFIPSVGVAVAIALLWRLISYYPYLLIGAFLVPKWIRNNFGKKKTMKN
ncbi:MAG: lysylphosphatidylglycerol synthase transmembrane domain-containing protein [Marinifilaceae bacterium]